MKQKQVLRVARFALLAGVVMMLAFWKRGNPTLTIPDGDQSMDPTYPGGSTVVFEEIDPDEPLERGTDVIYVMERDGVSYARFGRVRGLPGDVIGATEKGRITVNGEPVGPVPIPGKPMGEVPPGTVYILAVNPTESRYPDSRQLGFIPRDRVHARIKYRLR